MRLTESNYPLNEQPRNQQVFNGQLLVFRQVPAMLELIAYTDQLLRQHLNDRDPISAQRVLTPQQYLQLMGEAQYHFRTSDAPKRLFFAALKQVGVDANLTYWDHFPLRVVPCDSSHDGGLRAGINHHRDTWGSNIQAQVNWWAPVYPITADRTITFYPDYWHRPIANTTATWSFRDYLNKRRHTPKERAVDYPSAPQPSEVVNESGAVQIVIEPGDLLCFSSAHMHASTPNTSDATRFSIEMRTINIDDILANRGAPNIDNAGTPAMYDWFRRISDGAPLSQILNQQGTCKP